MVRFYSVDPRGCVYCGDTFLRSLRKAVEAQRDGGGLDELRRLEQDLRQRQQQQQQNQKRK